ncbi:hypothetical protein GCM10017774_49320 [Lentzea cavernae]|uniref:PIN like domain-containing protein n=2 Tax=Lentzea cavernae TaxID=2020703 RepID=A0ABQ3MIZ4_9PSEU|nr:hypothetical protein GCM10017774_49320 [Lentzea cavernae]
MGGEPRGLTPGGLSAGFEGYLSPSDEDYRAVLTSGLVVLDTNVLLNLYRFDQQARVDLLAVLWRIRDGIWIPHQALEEFWRNREAAILSRSNMRREALDALQKPVRAISHTIENWCRSVGISRERQSELMDLVDSTHRALRGVIEVPDGDDPLHGARDTNRDPVFAALRPMLEGRVGTGLPSEDLVVALQEADRRAAGRIPPGYMDRDKPDHRGPGDYLVWEQTLREAGQRSVDVLFVTSDVKEDWWRKVRGAPAGPRVELVDELRDRAGTRLFMLQPQQLLGIVGRLLDVEVRPDSEKQIETAAKGTSGQGSGDGDRVRLYLTSALERLLPSGSEVATNVAVNRSAWDVSVTVGESLGAVVWIYDPVKPFNDLATDSVILTARQMVEQFKNAVRRPWMACVVDLANLMTRMRADVNPWERARNGDGELMNRAVDTFQPYLDELRQIGFDEVEVVAGVDQGEPPAAEAFQRIDRLVQRLATSLDTADS